MKKFRITVQAEMTVSFDENSEDFKDLWEGYKSAINSDANYESFAESIASLISRYGISEMIEGVGFVKHNGQNQNIFANGEYKERQGIVNVEVTTDLNGMVDFEIDYTADESDN